MSDYPGNPPDYTFGTEFNYALWTPGTEVSLVNVPWNNDYRDVVKFATSAALDVYIEGRKPSGVVIPQLSYVKPNQPVRVNIPHTRAQKYNYLRASNPLQPIPDDEKKNYYYFILDVRYIAPNTTELVLQLDVFQTYMYSVEFGNCYVERGHIGIANENNFDNYGRDYLTVPEGIDVGGEYQVITTKNKWIMTPTVADITGGSGRYPGYDVLVVSTTDLDADPGTVSNPILTNADGTKFQSTTQGASFWIFDSQQFYLFMQAMKTKPWVTQGIISVTMIPKFTRYHPDFEYSEEVLMGVEASSNFPETKVHDMWPIWRSSATFKNYIGSRYDHLKKLWTYPYMAIELTTFNATPVVLKPEAWNTAHARVFERASLLPPGQRIEFSPRYYNALNNQDEDLPDLYPGFEHLYAGVKGDDGGEYIDLVTQIANFPTMSVVNSGQLGYLASNVHGIAFQRQSADWSQNRALGMAQGQYDVATGAMSTGLTQAKMGIVADYGLTANSNALLGQTTINTAGGDLAGSIGAGGAFGGGRGAAAGAMSAGAHSIANGMNASASIAAADQAAAIRNNTALTNAELTNTQSGLSRDTNKDLADWAARGDYANSLAGINAKVQDAALIQPTTSGQIGGEAMNMINGGWQVSLRWKMIDKAAMRIIGEYWLRYGYAIRAFIKPPKSLMVMKKFTYWKMSETYIVNAFIPEGHKQAIRGIFEKGVTVWANPVDIGKIDIADNEPLDGIKY